MAFILDAPVHTKDFALMSFQHSSRLDRHDRKGIKTLRDLHQRRVVELNFFLFSKRIKELILITCRLKIISIQS